LGMDFVGKLMSTKQLLKGQTEEERKDLRSSIRNVGEEIESNKDKIMDIHSDAFEIHLTQVNALHEKVRYPSEAIPDYENVKLLSELGKRLAEKLNPDMQISVRDVITKLIKRFTPINELENPEAEVDWYGIGMAASPYLRSVQVTGFMNGSVCTKIAEKKRKKERKKHPNL